MMPTTTKGSRLMVMLLVCLATLPTRCVVTGTATAVTTAKRDGRHYEEPAEADEASINQEVTGEPSSRSLQRPGGMLLNEDFAFGEGNGGVTNPTAILEDQIDETNPVSENDGEDLRYWPAGELNCAEGIQEFKPLTQKSVYHVGVHASSGVEEAWRQFNMTFVTYLNEAVGKRFNPPITFEMSVSDHPLRDWVDLEADVDFMYSDTGIFSCIESEIGAQLLGTTVSHLEARGHDHKLDMIGGMIFTRSDNKSIRKFADMKDKVIGALAMNDFEAAQVQFWQMTVKDQTLDYIMDPAQVVFAGVQEEVVLGVMEGRYDVGLVRTGMFERTIDPATGELIDADLFKVIEPKIYMLDDGQLFPFVHSTPVFPEWPFFSKPRVDRTVSEEVANALINFESHYDVGRLIHACQDAATTEDELSICNTQPPIYFDPAARCDTTREMAELAYQAGKAGRFAGMRTPRSYGIVRSMQEDAGLLLKNEETGQWFCKRASSTYESFICPEGHYKVRSELYDELCNNAGLPCPEGSDCYCKPCINAFEIEVSTEQNPNCEKMSVCGSVEQTETIVFTVHDNLLREDAHISALIHVGQTDLYPTVYQLNNDTSTYKFEFSHNMKGVAMLELFSNGIQIEESPFRIQVVERECPNSGKVPNEVGQCICGDDTIEIRGTCLDKGIFAAIMSSACLGIALHFAFLYVSYRRRKSDEMWQINTEELHFDHPVEVIGQGAFGVVLGAEYRGTKVAIKRVLPQQVRSSSKASRIRNSGSILESKEDDPDVDIEAQVTDIDMPLSSGGGKAAGSAENSADSSGILKNSMRSKVRNDSVLVSSKAGTTSSKSGDNVLEFLGSIGIGNYGKKSLFQTINPWSKNKNESSEFNLKILGTASGGSSTQKPWSERLLPWCDENHRRKEEFKDEMRLLSRLRHPCITTVMGAVMNGCEPMMVMEYMENGSLYDLLRNETLYTGGEIIVQILRDIAQGLRFLHASKPPILHGDLKAKNILVDSRFRAKVCDFGLSTKKKHGLSGTPFWMAPEYLRRKTGYTPACDIYAFGFILYEIYSRKNPYEGVHPRRVLRNVCDPRINYRPEVPSTCPPRLSEMMQKCWNADVNYRPEAKELDMIFTDMTPNDAEPIMDDELKTKIRTEVATGDLLYKVFPKKVADKLKVGQKVEAETHDNVTVFFSDIIRFTDISQSLSAVKVSHMLDRLYLAFDELASKHDVFKVETIGDAWMGVTNLENDQNETHAKRIAEFAVDVVEAASHIPIDEDDPRAGFLHIRVGFHSGQVVSNVIGSLNPRYGLFGDTVNTASRMESLSQSGKIQCSEAAAKLLKEQAPDMPLRRRGKIAVKGKGNMATYFVGEGLLREREDGSFSRTFNETPVVAFAPQSPEGKLSQMQQAQNSQNLQSSRRMNKSRRSSARPPSRIDMVGSVTESYSKAQRDTLIKNPDEEMVEDTQMSISKDVKLQQLSEILNQVLGEISPPTSTSLPSPSKGDSPRDSVNRSTDGTIDTDMDMSSESESNMTLDIGNGSAVKAEWNNKSYEPKECSLRKPGTMLDDPFDEETGGNI